MNRFNKSMRVVVLVDVQNVFYAARDQFNGKLDFQKLIDNSVGKRSLIRAIAYCVTCPGTDPKAFHNSLKMHGFDVKEKFLKMLPEGGSKGNWDVGMTIDGMLLGQSCDVIILVSGDGDFVDLVNYLKMIGKRVEAVVFHGATATELLNAVDQYTWVDSSWIIGEKTDNTCDAVLEGHQDY